MTHQHNSNGMEWLMVEVPGGATDIKIESIEGTSMLTYLNGHTRYVTIMHAVASIHSDSLTITEEQAGEIVDEGHNGVGYKCYDPIVTHIVEGYPFTYFEGSPYIYATDSYRSLLRSLQINSRVINLVRI